MTQPPYPPPPPPASQPGPTAGQPGDMVNRFVAKLVDWVILVVAIVVITMVLTLLSFGMSTRGYLWDAFTTILSAAIAIGYFSFLESSRGQTIGKTVMKMRVENVAGGLPSMEQALKRNAYMAFSLLGLVPFFGGVLSSLAGLAAMVTIALTINSDTVAHRGWHDNFAGTRVINTD